MSHSQEPKQPQEDIKPLSTTESTEQWENNLIQCTPCGPFWKAIACPCIFYGQTAQRLRDPNLPAERNNADCTDFAMNHVLLSMCFIDIMKQRAEIRKRYNIPSTETRDCLVSCFCCSCALLQQDNELRGRQEKEGIRVGYKSQPGMAVVPGGGQQQQNGNGGGVLQL